MIRWITKNLGTAPADSAEIDDGMALLDVRDLVDKGGNRPEFVRQKIESGAALVREGKRVIVCCDYGISRSNAIAAGVLAQVTNVPLAQAVQTVMCATGENEIKLDPLDVVRSALEDEDPAKRRSSAPRVLITGGSGFIGRHLAAALAGIAEHVITVGSSIDLTAGAVALDLLVHEHGIDEIVHLANPRVYTSNRAMGDSLSMLRNVLDVCRVSGVRLLYMSSWEVYSGYRAREISADESLPQRPKGPYGETKVLAESLLEHQRSMHGLDYTIVRASPVYGEGSDKPKFLHTFVRKALAGVPVIRTHRYSNGLPMLDLLDVDDLIGLVASVIAEKAEGAFNVGGGKLYSTAEIAKMVGKLCGVECRIEFEEIDDAIANVLMDSSRARALLGWKPTANFEDKLNELVARHRAELS